MGIVIKFEDTRKQKLNKAKIDKLVFEKGMIIGDAELTEIDRLIHLEYLKAGYTMEELCL